MKNTHKLANLAALFTVVIWGTTFISTKVLLRSFDPVEILFIRFVIGLCALWIVCPRRVKHNGWQEEALYAAAGLSGICLYYLLENIALTYTSASNVGIIVATAPFFTAILSSLFLHEDKPKASFFVGFGLALAGIAMVSFGGSALEVNPFGDLLSLLAAIVWAIYSVLTRKISKLGEPVVLSTRRIFTWGILFMIPAMFVMDFHPDVQALFVPVNALNLLYLGAGASAACFVTWNFSVNVLGALKTSVYIYLVPIVTVIASVLVLHEQITAWAALGIVLTLLGLILSEGTERFKKTKA